MSDHTEFDDLARRKLEERSFAFDPADWEDMQRRLPQRPRRRLHPAWFALLLLLPLGAAVERMLNVTSSSTAEGSGAGTAPVTNSAEGHSARPHGAGPTIASTTNTVRHGTMEEQSAIQPAGNTRNAPTSAPHPTNTAAQRTATPRPVQHTDHQASVNGPEAITIHAAARIASDKGSIPQGSEPVVIPIDPDEANDTTEGSIGNPLLTIGSAPSAPTDAAIDGIKPTPTSNTASTSDALPNASMAAGTYGDTTTAWDRTDTAPAQTAPPVLPDSLPPAADSASSTLWPPLPTRPHWELTAWGGALTSRTRYAGERTADWAAEHVGRTSSAFGVEFMRTQGHFGIGTGLHYITYADRLEGRGLTDSHTQLTWLHQFQGVDTTILVTNGTTVINGQTYYVTYSLDTTIMVLVTTSEEETVTTVRRNALARTNRTSYLELPLLLDGHTDRGKWRLGIRGGPTLGVLQGRRGVLPGQVGYTDLNDEAFRELVFGWSAQAYIRYRLAPNWSVGLGPSARGQLGNTMQGDDLTRRSTAWGITLGVSYDLR